MIKQFRPSGLFRRSLALGLLGLMALLFLTDPVPRQANAALGDPIVQPMRPMTFGQQPMPSDQQYVLRPGWQPGSENSQSETCQLQIFNGTAKRLGLNDGPLPAEVQSQSSLGQFRRTRAI